jgi:hypothetical protein
MFITTEVIIDAELGAERTFPLCQRYQVITRFDKPPRRFEQPLYGGQDRQAVEAVLSNTSSPTSCAYASSLRVENSSS